jgi:cytoskeletal protein RodZ
METLGQFLRREREFRGISLEKLAGMTRINPGVLKKLEENDFGRTAQAIYVRSFLKSYAGQLGLDAGEVLRRYEGQAGDAPSETSVLLAATSSRSGEDGMRGYSLIWATLALVAASGVFLFARYFHHH